MMNQALQFVRASRSSALTHGRNTSYAGNGVVGYDDKTRYDDRTGVFDGRGDDVGEPSSCQDRRCRR